MPDVKRFLKDILDCDKVTIGCGGYGIVYKIKHAIHGTIAVKNFFYSPWDFESDKVEINNLANLSHNDYMVRFLGALVDETGNYVGHVTTFMDGGSLYDCFDHFNPHKSLTVIHQGPDYQLKQVFSWMEQAAYALSYLHWEGIVHRDVKPSNMLLSDNHTNLKICDLGLSRPIADISSSGRGTYMYMSPEAIVFPKTVSYSSDVWSLGVSMWETLKRRCPYGELNNCQIIILAAKEELTPSWEGDSDEGMGELLARMWQMDPEARPKMLEIREIFTIRKDTCVDRTIPGKNMREEQHPMEPKTLTFVSEPSDSGYSNSILEGLPGADSEDGSDSRLQHPHRLYWTDGSGKLKDIYENAQKAVNKIDTKATEEVVGDCLFRVEKVWKETVRNGESSAKKAKPFLKKLTKW